MRPQDLETLKPENLATFRPLEVMYCIQYPQILKSHLQKTLTFSHSPTLKFLFNYIVLSTSTVLKYNFSDVKDIFVSQIRRVSP
jgi:hypothetical protein